MATSSKEKRWNTYVYSKGKTTEENSGEVKVVPDQSYTIQEVFEKFRRGVRVEVTRPVGYSNTDDFDAVDERSMIQDYTDIKDSLDRIATRKARKKVILDAGLPDSESPSKSDSGSGVKAAGNNLISDESK